MDLFLDTETTGLAKGLAWETDYRQFPHILTIAWKRGKELKYHIIYQEGRKVPAEATAANGLTTDMVNSKRLTTPAKDVYDEFIMDSINVSNVIGHNIYFDVSMIKANVLRLYGNGGAIRALNENLHKDKRIDTMRQSMGLFKNRWPKLSVLYEGLFPGESFNAHRADEDVLATERCYYELKRRKVI